MAIAALPAAGSRRVGARALSAVRSAAASAVRLAVTPHKASLKRLADIPLTVTGVGCADFAAWHISHGWGWLITGLSLVLVEHLIADDQ